MDCRQECQGREESWVCIQQWDWGRRRDISSLLKVVNPNKERVLNQVVKRTETNTHKVLQFWQTKKNRLPSLPQPGLRLTRWYTFHCSPGQQTSYQLPLKVIEERHDFFELVLGICIQEMYLNMMIPWRNGWCKKHIVAHENCQQQTLSFKRKILRVLSQNSPIHLGTLS